ncbi:MAG: SWFGD domain-containing protein, partial [Pseudomonadota bacterium]
MGYQSGRRYGDDRYSTGWDRGDRYRGQRDYRGDDRGSRYGTRGQFGGPDYRRTPDDYDPEERGFFDRAGDEIRSWFGDEEA